MNPGASERWGHGPWMSFLQCFPANGALSNMRKMRRALQPFSQMTADLGQMSFGKVRIGQAGEDDWMTRRAVEFCPSASASPAMSKRIVSSTSQHNPVSSPATVSFWPVPAPASGPSGDLSSR